jgi:hypothetical protein
MRGFSVFRRSMQKNESGRIFIGSRLPGCRRLYACWWGMSDYDKTLIMDGGL